MTRGICVVLVQKGEACACTRAAASVQQGHLAAGGVFAVNKRAAVHTQTRAEEDLAAADSWACTAAAAGTDNDTGSGASVAPRAERGSRRWEDHHN